MIAFDQNISRFQEREYMEPIGADAGIKPRPAPRTATPRLPDTPRELAAPAPFAPTLIPATPTAAGGGITVNAPKVPETPQRALIMEAPAAAGVVTTRTEAGGMDMRRTLLLAGGFGLLLLLLLLTVRDND